MKKFTGDFETATWRKNETWVWAYALSEIGNEENLIIGNNIDEFIEKCKMEKNCEVFFHNLKFDGSFLLYWALTHNFTLAKNKEEIKDNTFTTVISDRGEFYEIVFYFKKSNKHVHKITFHDSLKIIPFSVSEIANYYNLPISKLKIDYNKPRKRNHILTKNEKEYIKNDVLITSKALKMTFEEGLTKMTRAGSALKDYKEIITTQKFNHYFPKLDIEVFKDLKQAYKGGFTYLNPIYKEKDINKDIINLDINSLYPYIMYEKLLPYGEPIYYEGEYKEDKVYPLYIQKITCCFKLKENKIPTIQIKDNPDYIPNEYLESSDDEQITLFLTNIDLKLFEENYEIWDKEYECGWKFHGIHGLFKEYIDKWIKKKNQATIEGNLGIRTESKLMLNSLYGKLGKNMENKCKYVYLGEDGILHYEIGDTEENEGLYLPMAEFITAYAREKTIRSSMVIKEYSIKNYNEDMHIYNDTDSIKTTLPLKDLEKLLDIDNVRLGAWKNEGIATRGRWIRQKCYIEEIDNKIHITCAGLPKNCYDKVEWDNFKVGFTCGGKLTYKNVKGGVKLIETDFTIKEDKIKKEIKKSKI